MLSFFWSGEHLIPGSAALESASDGGASPPPPLVATPRATSPPTTATMRTVASTRWRCCRLRLASRAAICAFVGRRLGGRFLVLATAYRLFRKQLDDPRHALGEVVI